MSSTASDTDITTHRIHSDLDGLEDLFMALQTIPEIFDSHDDRMEGVEERLNEELETVEDLSHAFECVLSNLNDAECELESQRNEFEALRNEVDEIRDELDALRGLFSGRVLEKEDAHLDAQRRDASDVVEIGEVRTVVISDTAYGDPRDPTAITHIEGLVTFIPAPEEELAEGDTVEIRIADLGESHARAVCVEGDE